MARTKLQVCDHTHDTANGVSDKLGADELNNVCGGAAHLLDAITDRRQLILRNKQANVVSKQHMDELNAFDLMKTHIEMRTSRLR